MLALNRLSTLDPGFEPAFERLIAFEGAQDEAIERATAEILDAVRARGDAALIELTRRFDRWEPASAVDLEIDPGEARKALESLPRAERAALEFAAARIRTYHEHQPLASWRIDDGAGTVLGQQVTPLDRVGL